MHRRSLTAAQLVGLLVSSTTVAAILLVGLTAACSQADTTDRPASIGVPRVKLADCTDPAPNTASGYAALWAALDPDVWGAADVSLSVKMGDRRVWLYGDTMSNGGRMVHSSAITQDAGCLNVSQGGAQLLPDDDPDHIYWIHSAVKTSETTIKVTARSILLTGEPGIWGFEDNGFFRTAQVVLDVDGDVSFVKWTGKAYSPEPDSGPLYQLDDQYPNHFGYSMKKHTIVLANGRNLWTIAQTWDDGQLHGWANHRPLFADQPWH